jgi:quercetin dioxygenase-like cupin family protein
VEGSVSWDGEGFAYGQGRARISVRRLVVSPGTHDLSLAYHCHPEPLAAYVAKGAVKVVKPSGESAVFKTGDAFIEVMNQWHKGVFTEPTELVVFYAGTEGTPLTIRQHDASAPENDCH